MLSGVESWKLESDGSLELNIWDVNESEPQKAKGSSEQGPVKTRGMQILHSIWFGLFIAVIFRWLGFGSEKIDS